MKKLMLILCLAITTIAVPEFASAQKYPGLDASPADIAYLRPGGRNADPVARVVYGRPQKKDREMLGKKEPFGKVWRAGANETTEIKFYKDVTFGGKDVKAGTYSLYVIPNEDNWTIIVNSKLDTWGAYAYDKSADVVRFDVPVEKPSSEIEAFSIAFENNTDGSTMYMGWENYQVAIPVK